MAEDTVYIPTSVVKTIKNVPRFNSGLNYGTSILGSNRTFGMIPLKRDGAIAFFTFCYIPLYSLQGGTVKYLQEALAPEHKWVSYVYSISDFQSFSLFEVRAKVKDTVVISGHTCIKSTVSDLPLPNYPYVAPDLPPAGNGITFRYFD